MVFPPSKLRAALLVCLALTIASFQPSPAADATTPSANSDELAQYDAVIQPADREHWSYRPVQSPAVPMVRDVAWPQNPLDNFILAKLEAKAWKPAAAVDRRVWLRRIYLDVIGLPPTLEEQDRFENDPSPTAFVKVVDDLLSRPGYGERWGRHWLDLVRFAETNGYERDAIKPQAWRYRDYVIRSLNDDKPYDRFILEQLAGDELADATADSLIATGYYRLGPWDDEPADFPQDRADQLDDLVQTTSRVFLGITLACSRCHNHKFDPLTMHDYYRMAAVFDPLSRPQNGRTELDSPAGSRDERAAIAERDRKIAEINNQIAAIRGAVQGELPIESKGRILALEAVIASLRVEAPDLPRGYFMVEASPKPPTTHLLLRGRAAAPGPVVGPGMPAVLVSRQPEFLPADQHTTRRRLTLAQWIATADNPLTARVIVNRVWQYHFGEGIVSSSSDFGRIGIPPSHPELLDWLAHWFTHEGQWSLKKLHRLILTSSTYRMSKQWNAEYGATDPENRDFWRFPYRRLEVEAIRDSMLVVSGKLSGKMYGESNYLSVPKEALDGHSDPGQIWKPFDEDEDSRRTVYAFIKRSMVVPMLEVLDLCDTTRSEEKRKTTSVATQALTLFNGDFVNRQSRHLADRLLREAGDDKSKQIETAYRLALCRKPSVDELATWKQFLPDEADKLSAEAGAAGRKLASADAHRLAIARMCRIIFNLNEFVYPD
ncbi:MAG: DUF1549 and DUF1553 domain-containing protein [Planctomycetaceae bacterium]